MRIRWIEKVFYRNLQVLVENVHHITQKHLKHPPSALAATSVKPEKSFIANEMIRMLADQRKTHFVHRYLTGT
jgi:hypothetical protein